MSHITTCASKIAITNEAWIKKAISLMSAEFNGITFEQKTPDMIVVRYKPIEGYQTKGNLRFVFNPVTKIWDLQLDIWQCESEVMKVKNAFEKAYPIAGVLAWSASRGYTTAQSAIKNGQRVIASKW
jgi:hypothetical protein